MVREHNEDAHGHGPDWAAVADGMGGHRAGEVASQLTLKVVAARMARNRGMEPEERAADAILRAHDAILHEAESVSERSGMGTTIVLLVNAGEGRVLVANVGDSRCYRLRAGRIEAFSVDDNLPLRHDVITQALGIRRVVPHIKEVSVESGDLFLLCSDGLTGEVHDDRIKEILTGPGSADEKVRKLVAAANEHGGLDNITASIVEVAGTAEASFRGARRQAVSMRAAPRPGPGKARSNPCERARGRR
jgi:protein phosphatase